MQLGWLRATPTSKSDSGKVMSWDETRGEHELRVRKAFPLLDHEGSFEYVRLLLRIKPLRRDPMGGVRVVDFQDLYYFQQMTGDLSLEYGEPELILRFAEAFYEGWKDGQNPLSIMPIEREVYLGHCGTRLQKRLFASSPFD